MADVTHLLFHFKYVIVEVLLEFFVGVVDAKLHMVGSTSTRTMAGKKGKAPDLLKRIVLEDLKTKDVQQANSARF